MAYDSRAIANFFLGRADQASQQLTPMSLLKILYFAHAWHLAKYKEPLVAQPFEAWERGPVNRVVYEQVKKFGKGVVSERLKVLDPRSVTFVDANCDLTDDLKTFLGNIFSYYSQYHAFELSDITHASGTPWDTVWNAAENGAVPGMWISNELILNWFEKTGGRLYLDGEQGANA